jgi:uncharacterized protein YjgD (DUF1641 family)
MNTDNQQELLSLYRENNTLRDELREADISNIEKITAIKDAIDELHQLIATMRPSGEVIDVIDQLIADLEESIR